MEETSLVYVFLSCNTDANQKDNPFCWGVYRDLDVAKRDMINEIHECHADLTEEEINGRFAKVDNRYEFLRWESTYEDGSHVIYSIQRDYIMD